MLQQPFAANGGSKAGKEQPSGLERTPGAQQHRSEVIVVAGKMKDGVAYDEICKGIWKRVRFDSLHAKVFRRLVRREPPNGFNRVQVRVDSEYVVALTQKIHDIPAAAATRIEDLHSSCDVSSQKLIKQVDIDTAELFL